MAERRYKNIVFIEPKSTHIHVYSLVHIPRIGSLLLGSLLRDKGYNVDIIVEDMLPRKTTDANIWEKIKQADMLCVSSITLTVSRCYNYCARAREQGIPVVIGGTHVSYFPDEAIEHADYVMRGECDETFPQFMDVMEAGGDLSVVPGLTWRDKAGDVRQNPDQKLPSSDVLEANPFPDYSLLWNADLQGVASFAVARGCPFNCSFCSVTKFNGAAVRMVSATRTLDMIEEHWKRYHPHYIFFAEDIFNLRKDRAKEIMRGLIERKIRPRIGFGAQMRHEVVKDPEFLQLMRGAGFDRAMVGFESINQASLDLCGKHQGVQEIADAIREFHRHKIKVHGMFVGGFDTDTSETFRDTLKFVKKHDLDSFQFMLLTPLPGTRDWHDLGYGDGTRPLLSRDWSKYDGHHSILVPRQMTAYEANELAIKTMKDFYSIPRALKRFLRRDFVEGIFRIEARGLIKKWLSDPENRGYLEMLRGPFERCKRPSTAAARHIIIAHTAGSIALREKLDRFFAEFGVQVEHSRAGLGEILGQGQVKASELKQRISEFLGDYKLFDRRKAAMVVVAADCGSETNIDAMEIDQQTPLLVHLNINQKASVLAHQCVQIAMQFTNDIKFAGEAFRRAMQEPPLRPAAVQ